MKIELNYIRENITPRGDGNLQMVQKDNGLVLYLNKREYNSERRRKHSIIILSFSIS